MAEEKQSKKEMPVHENVIFNCFGGYSNTGITAALASLEAVKDLGLDKVCIGCLAALPLKVLPVFDKTKAARKIITMDGCPKECSRKIVEKAGFEIARSFVLARDIGMEKRPLHADIGGDLKPMMEYISEEDIKKAKELIVKAINDEVN